MRSLRKVFSLKVGRSELQDVGAWVLVLCALFTTMLVARRELAPSSTVNAAGRNWEAVYVDGWQESSKVGVRSGPETAPVQIVEFADFQCAYCARFDLTTQKIRDKYPSQVAVTFAPFPLPYHEHAETAHLVAECADLEGRFERMRSLLFERQKDIGQISWTDFARLAGIQDISQFDACVTDPKSLIRIDQSKKLAHKLGVRGTPYIIVNGWKMPVTPSAEIFDEIVENVLEGDPPAKGIDFVAMVSRN